jgi:Na+/proline symporter
MKAETLLLIIAAYFAALLFIAWKTGKGADNRTFFLANRAAPWYLVAFGMIGTSLSGVTFISVPGTVVNPNLQFSYMQIVIGYLLGYVFIALVLLPVYYRLQLTSIYTYLEKRFGTAAYKTGAFYFLVSRMLGSAIRLLLVAGVLYEFVFKSWNISFEVTVAVSIGLIWVYTFKGGIKTIVWTDTLQTLFMLISLGVSIYYIGDALHGWSGGLGALLAESPHTQWFFLDEPGSTKNFVLKDIIGGFFICIGMTGMDQDMMQKNLSCRNLKDAQKNMLSFAAVLFFVNLAFLVLGALMFQYVSKFGIEIPLVNGSQRNDLLFPELALSSDLPLVLGFFFIIGLVAAAYSSADGALAAMTTSVCIDFLGFNKKAEKEQTQMRQRVHISVSLVLFVVILILHRVLELSAIEKVVFLAGFTYGPLIGMFIFGLYSHRAISGAKIVAVALVSPVLTYMLLQWNASWQSDYKIGAELIAFNALFTWVGLWLLSRKASVSAAHHAHEI